MFDAMTDQAAGLRRLFRMHQRVLIPVGSLVPDPVGRGFAGRLVERLAAGGLDVGVLNRQAMNRMLSHDGLNEELANSHFLWLDDPVEMARWVAAHSADRMLLLLSHRREAMMSQYAQIKEIVATTGIRRFGLIFVDIEQAARGRQAFLGLAGCARRFLDARLDVVVSSAQDDADLAMCTGLSTAELSDFECPAWLDHGVPAAPPAGGAH